MALSALVKLQTFPMKSTTITESNPKQPKKSARTTLEIKSPTLCLLSFADLMRYTCKNKFHFWDIQILIYS